MSQNDRKIASEDVETLFKDDLICFGQLNKAGIVMKTGLISAVYRKSLKIQQPNGKSNTYTVTAQLQPCGQSFKALYDRNLRL